MEITSKEKSISKKFFEYFDTCISINETNNAKRQEENKTIHNQNSLNNKEKEKEENSTNANEKNNPTSNLNSNSPNVVANNKILEQFKEKNEKFKKKNNLFDYIKDNIDNVLMDLLEEE